MENNAEQKKRFSKTAYFSIFIFLMAIAISSIFWGEDRILFFGFPSSFVFFFLLQIILSLLMAWFAKQYWHDEEER